MGKIISSLYPNIVWHAFFITSQLEECMIINETQVLAFAKKLGEKREKEKAKKVN